MKALFLLQLSGKSHYQNSFSSLKSLSMQPNEHREPYLNYSDPYLRGRCVLKKSATEFKGTYSGRWKAGHHHHTRNQWEDKWRTQQCHRGRSFPADQGLSSFTKWAIQEGSISWHLKIKEALKQWEKNRAFQGKLNRWSQQVFSVTGAYTDIVKWL